MDRQITVIDKNPLPSKARPRGIRYLIGDYGVEDYLVKSLKDVDEVIHLAYSTVPKTSFEKPVQDVVDNLPAIVGLLEVASSLEIEKLVLVSSGGAIYGRARKVPIREDHPTNPISPYGITKLTGEKYANMFYKLKGLPVVCLRPSNAYGEGQKPFLEQGFVATAIASIINQREVNIFGDRGTIRDYIHVNDIANGIIAVLECGKAGSCYNIGSGVGRSNEDILNSIHPFAESAGLETHTRILPSRPFDVSINILDSSKLMNETDWREKISFDEGIKKTWDWFYKKTFRGNTIIGNNK